MAFKTIPLEFERLSAEDGRARVRALLASLAQRRSVRDFAPDPVPPDIVDTAIEAAATAPSGANRQPWRFVLVRDPEVKRRIREAAEAEEREFYERPGTGGVAGRLGSSRHGLAKALPRDGALPTVP
jgi:nitroreductase